MKSKRMQMIEKLQMKWKKYPDEKPCEGLFVLHYDPAEEMFFRYSVRLFGGRKFMNLEASVFSEPDAVSYWMELPESPKT